MRILGIDAGKFSIKAVEIESAFGRYDIHDYHEQPLSPDLDTEAAISQLVQGLPKAPDKIVVSVPSRLATFRNLHLPTRDKKAIQASVGFELEDELPFDSENAVYDYTIVNQNKQGSHIHVSASLRSHIVSTLDFWKRSKVDPDTLTTDIWAYRSLLNRVLGASSQEQPVLLVHLGHEKTVFYLHWKGIPAFVKEVGWGGQDLTTAICQKLNIPIEQAESAKLDRGFIPTSQAQADTTPEQVELSECLLEAAVPLLRELRQVELVTKSITKQSIHLMYLGGGPSLLPGLGPWIEENLNIPVKPLLALSAVTTSGVTYSDQTDARFTLAASLALACVGSDRTNCINFRKGEFSKSGKSREFNAAVLKKPLIAVGTVAFCLLLSLVVQSSVYKSRLASTDTQLEKSVKNFFGGISGSALRTYMANPGTLRTSINRELNKQRELARLLGPNSRSPLDFLNNLSTSIPKDVVVDLVQFQAGGSPTEPFSAVDATASAQLTFLVSNPQMAERLAVLLNNKIGNLQRGKIEEVAPTDGGAKKWKISFSGKPNEDTYGK